MRCHCVPFGPFSFHSPNKQMPVGYWFYFYSSERAIYSNFMKILVPSPVFISWKNPMMKVKLCKVYTLQCQLCLRYNKIREFDTLERQTMEVNTNASTFLMASCYKKRCNHRKKMWRKKYESTQLFLQVSNWGKPGCVNTHLTQKLI